MRTFKRKDLQGYISAHIDIVSVLYKEDKDWLRPREKEFLVYNLVLRIKGVDIKSTESVVQLQKLMGFSSRDDVYNYRNKLKSKGWIEQTKDDIIFPGILDVFMDGSEEDNVRKKLNYKFTIELT